MAKYSTNTEELKGIANAIRAKGGTSATLEYPTGFEAAVEAIPAGVPQEYIDAIMDRSVTEVYSNAARVGRNALRDCGNLVSARFPNATVADYCAFYYCQNLEDLDAPNLEVIGENAFDHCYKLKQLDLARLKSIGPSAFDKSLAFDTLIIRSPQICTLANANAFSRTPIADGTGYIYVPKALVDQYKAAANWSTYAAQIRAIEDYPDITGGVV